MQETSTHSREEIAIEVEYLENGSYESVYHIKCSSGFKKYPEIGKKIEEVTILTAFSGITR